MSLLRVKDHDGLYKDSSTGAVINKDTSGYQQYMENRSKMLSDKERLDSIESDINDIKSLLLKVLESNGQSEVLLQLRCNDQYLCRDVRQLRCGAGCRTTSLVGRFLWEAFGNIVGEDGQCTPLADSEWLWAVHQCI